jgi:adenine deaminase
MIIRNAKIVNVFTKQISEGSLVIEGKWIKAILPQDADFADTDVFDAKECYVLPGLIDSHAHIEMSYLSARSFAKAVLPFGTTGAILDAHDMMNALGTEGLRLIVDELKTTKLKGYWMAPPCVPSSPAFEDAFGKATLDTVKYCVEKLGMMGIAETMDYDRVIEDEPELLKILDWARGKGLFIDGHAPELSDSRLQRYLAMGPMSDHECVTADEMLEKYALGVHVMLRKGSLTEPLELHNVLKNIPDTSRVLLCTDGSISPRDLVDKGYMNFALAALVKDGFDPMTAVCMATINVARAYRLDRVGAIAPGYHADLCIVSDLKDFKVLDTFVDGERITLDNCFTGDFSYPEFACRIQRELIKPQAFEFVIKFEQCLANVLHVIDGTLATDIRQVVYRPSMKEIVKVSVIDRYRKNGSLSLGLLSGFGEFHGAFAGSIAQDTQNIIVVGDNSPDMALAVNHIIANNGGIAVVENGKIIEFAALPIAGIMSETSAENMKVLLTRVTEQAKKQGCTVTNPVFTISLQIPLAVIPKGAITNRGLLDVEERKFIPVFIESQ